MLPTVQLGLNLNLALTNPIKIVIWDLDETFWKGTLSEGAIDAVPLNSKTVQELSRRGIINSIASKNSINVGMVIG